MTTARCCQGVNPAQVKVLSKKRIGNRNLARFIETLSLTSVSIHFRLLAPQSGALRISAYRDFHPYPTLPLIAFEHLSLSIQI